MRLIRTALDDWLKAQGAGESDNLWKVYEDLTEEKQLLNTERAELEDMLPSSGEHIIQTASAEAASAAVRTCAR